MDSDIFNEKIFVLNEVVCSFAVRLECVLDDGGRQGEERALRPV